jgi:Na+/H+ antiporter NhaC
VRSALPGLLTAAVLVAAYAPGPRAMQSPAEIKSAAFTQLVAEFHAGKGADGSGLKIEGPKRCAAATGKHSVPLVRAAIEQIDSLRKAYATTEPAGCNYQLPPLTIGLIDSEERFGVQLGQAGVGPTWTVKPPQAKPVPDFRSIFPALLAIFIAVVWRRVLIGLGAGILYGCLLAADGGLASGAGTLVSTVTNTFTDSWNLWILVFTVALIVQLAIADAAGGVRGLALRLTRRVTNRRKAETSTAALGTMLFFDDYANTMVVGATMRPLTDRFAVSRAKLAYIVDSTAAPLAGVALLSTWIGFEVGLLQDISTRLNLGVDGYNLFLSALPARFYCFFALALVYFSTLSGRDMGPMLAAQRAAQLRQPEATADADDDPSAIEPKAWRVIVPVGLTLAAISAGLYAKAAAKLGAGLDLSSFTGWQAAIGVESATVAGMPLDIGSILALASLFGLLVALVIAVAAGLRGAAIGRAVVGGLRGVAPAIAILCLAWMMGGITGTLDASNWLRGLLDGGFAPSLLPAVVFLLAAGCGFATGTSFGTMAILLPLAGELGFAMGDTTIGILCLAAVLDGAIFGDHCSPLSDTTVMSSLSTGCSVDEHVRTQLPYALLAMVVALGIGYLPAGLGWYGAGLALPVGLITLALVFRFVSQPVTEPDPAG